MEKEFEPALKTYDIFSLLIYENYEKIQLFKDLITKVEEFSISPFYFFFKGLHYEYGIKKSKNQMCALEFYKQGANLNNFLCFYKLYLIYSYSNNNLCIIGDNKFYQSLFYLLKFFSYLDEECLIQYFIQFYYLEAHHFNQLKLKFKPHQKELIIYINKHQYDLNLEDREKEFLFINLFYLCDSNKSEYFLKLYELYKTNYHEETQYKIFCYLIDKNQIDSLENFLSNKISLDGNLKVFSFLIKTFLNNLQLSKKDCYFINQIINVISTDKKFWGRKLKFGCYFDIYADLKFYEIEVEQLYDSIIEDHFNSANSCENHKGNQNNTHHNSISNIVKKIDKLIIYYFKSLKFGSLQNIPKIFFLNLFANKNYLPFSQEEKIKIFTGMFEILENLFLPYRTIINPDIVDKRLYLSNEMILILALYYIKGIKIKKNYTTGIEILNYLMIDRLQSLTSDELIPLNFYLNKCKNKLRINDSENLKFCLNKLNFVYSEIRMKNNIEIKYSIQSLFYLIKTGLSESSKKESKNSMSEAMLIIMYLGNFYSNSSNSNINRNKISFTVLDKIYLCKILKLMKTRKEFSSRESYLNKLSKIPSFDNISIVSNPCDNCSACMINKKEALAVPCGHKLLCLNCYYQIKDDICELEYSCSKCNAKVESVIEKVYK